jgi:taurine transport system permease protein
LLVHAEAPAATRRARLPGPIESPTLRSAVLALLGAAVLIVIWIVVAALKVWPEVFVPPPGAVIDRFVDGVTTHDGQRGLMGYYLWEHLWASLWRILRGLGAAIVVGVALGAALGTLRTFRAVAEPLVSFIRALPPLGYFSLLIIWFGIEDGSKVWLLFLAAVAPIALSVAAGIRATPQGRIDAARALGSSRWQLVRHVLLPSALPQFFTGTRLAAGFAWTTIVAAETVNGIPGIGGLAWSTKKFQQTDVAVLCVIVIGLTAILVDLAIQLTERAVVPWSGRS